MVCIRKQVAPLDFQKFFVENIQKIKNGLRPSPPPLCGRASPQGEATKWLTIFAEKMKFAEFFSGKGKPSKSGNKYSLPLGGKVLSECEANEGRSTFLFEILYRNFQSRGVACCFILSNFSIMKLPLITALCAELPPGGKP